MSDVENTVAAETPVTEPVAAQPETTAEEVSKVEPTELPATESKPEETTPSEQPKDEAAAAEEKKDEPSTEKVVEPITEGQLAHKGPGFLKSLIPSKKEFWLTDEATSPQELSSYLRGEKPEISHPVAAWASQTGKGLLFFNKKGDTNKKSPGHVLALYDATDLANRSPHEIVFKLGGHEHTLKATSDAERDGWYMSIEKSVEMGKASKEEVHESEGYKDELEKLNKPHLSATAAAVASKRSQSQPNKTKEGEDATPAAEEEDKKKSKSRSQSRGVLNRLKSKKDEAPAKEEAKDEPKEESKEESKAEEESKTEEVAAGAAVAGVAGTAGVAAAAESSATEENKDSTESPVEVAKTEEKPKPAKRGSIFGKLPGFGSQKSPSVKPHELKPDVLEKNGAVVEDPPVLPETATTEPTDTEAEANRIENKAEKEVAKENGKEEVLTPSKEKSGFLSGLLPKRNRSVSPSAQLAKAESEAPKETTEEAAKTEEPATEAAAEESTDKPAEKIEEPAKTETTPTANKRQSMLGSLGRRASKAMGNMRAPKKENVAPTSEAAEETTEEKPLTNGEAKIASPEENKTIGDVVPEAISIGQTEQPPAVTASA